MNNINAAMPMTSGAPAHSAVIGFDPIWLRVGALCALVGVLAGATALGRSR